jgi:PadR family transcriptional regulator, regulatory protein PadR
MPPDYIGEFEQLVLMTILRLGDQAYGAAVRDEIADRTGRDVSLSAVYTTLERLELKKMLRSRIGEPTPQRGGRRKRYFALSAAGEHALQASWQRLKRAAEGLEPLLDRGRL